ncbi:MAG TPA: hybrid sensor histidine kinase/response regulator [Chloroflexota bacterium]|nr:hybrid sensor histidine kinase/response regulator [Chloroflexota bacterium]
MPRPPSVVEAAGGSGLAPSPEPGNEKPELLVVDDDESVLVTLQAVLQMTGYNVEARSTGADAITLLNQRQFDLVLTDLRLDDTDGITILSEIRRTSPETVAIMLTGYASLETAIKALREGAYDYLVKPCDVEELKATVARGLERRHLTKQLHRRMAELQEANETIRQLNQGLQQRVDEATDVLRQRLADLQKAHDQIAELHRAAEEHVEQLKELDRLKSQFLSMASHELKTPLTVISGFLQVSLRRKQRRLTRGHPAEAEWLDEQKADVEQLEVLNAQSQKLAKLVDELLDVSRIESGRLEFHFGEVDVRRLAADVTGRMQLTTTRHTLALVGNASNGATTITADRDHLEQVLNNLITNAIKYSPDGGPIDVEVRPDDGGVVLSVRDQGVGIPASELDAVFSLFYRSRAEGTRQTVSGMGLGLYISQEIVVRHGGRIWVDSTPGEGSTFYVFLPREPAASQGAAA